MPQTANFKLFIASALTAALLITLIAACAPAVAQTQTQTPGVYTIAAGASKIINISEPIKRVSVGNPGIAEYTVLSKNEIIILGVKVGRTEMHLWTENDFKTFIIKVYDDVIEMRSKLNEIMGAEIGSRISIHMAKDTVVIKGAVSSVYESEQIEKLAALYYPKILNLLEIKNKTIQDNNLKQDNNLRRINETRNPGRTAFFDAPQTVAIAETAAREQYPEQNTGNTKDILEIKAVENFRESPYAYGAGAASGLSGPAPLQSAEIPETYYKNVNDKTTRIITLQNAVASELEAALNKIKSPDGMIVIDGRTNSMVIIDKPAAIDKMEKLIKIFDAPTPQVLIEAKIVEVSLNDDMKNTLNWIYDTLYSGANPLGTALNNKSVKISDGTMDFALDYGKISSDHFSMKILPSLQKRHARLISSPSTVTLDKKEATFGVTDNIPYLKYTPQGTTGTLLPTPEYVSPAPGVTLKVTPNINQNDVIKMNINVQIGSFVENVNFGQYGSVPRTSSRQSSNFVEVNNGETLIISGLISNRSYNSANKVPWFSKIPLLGNMFESKIKGDERTELVIFITPRIVGKDSRFAQLDKDRYPKIVENKMPDVNDKFDMNKFLGIEKEKKTIEPPPAVKKNSVEADKTNSKATAVETLVSQPEKGLIEYKYCSGGADLNKTRKLIKNNGISPYEVKTSAAEKILSLKARPIITEKEPPAVSRRTNAVISAEEKKCLQDNASDSNIKTDIQPAAIKIDKKTAINPEPEPENSLKPVLNRIDCEKAPDAAPAILNTENPQADGIDPHPGAAMSKFRSGKAYELVEKLRHNLSKRKKF